MRPLGIKSVGVLPGPGNGLFWVDTGESIDCIYTNWSVSKSVGGPVLLAVTVEDDARVSATNGWLKDAPVVFRCVRIEQGIRYLDLVIELARADIRGV